MAGGFLKGLASLGLGKLENKDIYEKKEDKQKSRRSNTAVVQQMTEKDFIYDRTFKCPVCDKEFTSKIMKTGKAKLIGSDFDLRPKYEGIDAAKYGVVLCPYCAYAALTSHFDKIISSQAKLIREMISSSAQLNTYDDEEVYSYENAYERYKLCLANAVVKKAKNSEKAFVCLKSAWLLRGYREDLSKDMVKNGEKIKELSAEEDEYLQEALEGFTTARSTENMPFCGMDEHTIDYLLAQLNLRFRNFDDASRLVTSLLSSPTASSHVKNKALDLKDKIVEAKKQAEVAQ